MSSLPAFTPSRHVDVRWEEQGGATAYELRDRRASYNSGFGPYHQDGSSTETTFATFAATPGNTYCFSARAVDEAGNVSGWAKPTCTAIPLDDRALTANAGWKRSRSARSYLRTLTATSRRSASLTLTGIKAHRLALVAQRCRGCGEIRVSVNGARIQNVKLDAARTENRKIIQLGYFPRAEKGTITIEVISSGKPVHIDGLGVGRI
jgi:hypothetical protein